MDDTFALDGGAEALRWQARRARKAAVPKAATHHRGRRHHARDGHRISVLFDQATFSKVQDMAEKNQISRSEQIALLCEMALRQQS